MESMPTDLISKTLSFIVNDTLNTQFVCKLWRSIIQNDQQKLNRKYPLHAICPQDAMLPSQTGLEFVFVIDPSRNTLTEEERSKLYQGPFTNPEAAWQHFSDLCAEMVDDDDNIDTEIWWQRPIKFLLYNGIYSIYSLGDTVNGQLDGVQWIGMGNNVIIVPQQYFDEENSFYLGILEDTYMENIKFIDHKSSPIEIVIGINTQLIMKNCAFRLNCHHIPITRSLAITSKTSKEPKQAPTARLINCLFISNNNNNNNNKDETAVDAIQVNLELIECELFSWPLLTQLKQKMKHLKQQQKDLKQQQKDLQEEINKLDKKQQQ